MSFVFFEGNMADNPKLSKTGEKVYLNFAVEIDPPWKGSEMKLEVRCKARQQLAKDIAADVVAGQWIQIAGTLTKDAGGGVAVLVTSYGV